MTSFAPFKQSPNWSAEEATIIDRVSRLAADVTAPATEGFDERKKIPPENFVVFKVIGPNDSIVETAENAPRDFQIFHTDRDAVVRPDGPVTAGNASVVNDGVCGFRLTSEEAAGRSEGRRDCVWTCTRDVGSEGADNGPAAVRTDRRTLRAWHHVHQGRAGHRIEHRTRLKQHSGVGP